MKFIKVQSSHWPMPLEFKTQLDLPVGTCFKILRHDGSNNYPTRFKVMSISDTPEYSGAVVEILSVNLNVEPF